MAISLAPSFRKPESLALIPVYNEERFIKELITRTAPFVDSILIVNDGSTDGTAEAVPAEENIILLSHSFRKGKGAALRTGLEKALELKPDVVVTLDGDLQHAPEHIPALLSLLEKYDVAVGARERTPGVMPLPRRMSNYLTSKMLSVRTGTAILDSQSGYRAFRLGVIASILPEKDGFEAESEMLIKAALQNYSIGFAPVPTIYGDEKSKMQNLRAIAGFLSVLFRKY